MNAQTLLRKIAADYLQEEANYGLGPDFGYVKIFNCKPVGWMCGLIEPHRFEPGVYAVPNDGSQIFVSAGGNPSNGAKEWVPVGVNRASMEAAP